VSELTFDAYIDAIRVAKVVYLKTGSTQSAWAHAWCPLTNINLQFGTDGSARIVHGTMSAGDWVLERRRTVFPLETSESGVAQRMQAKSAVAPVVTNFDITTSKGTSTPEPANRMTT
jgi:hypothetical protein